MPPVDILSIAAHPDDTELCCAGTLIKHIDMGYSVGLCDLTQGELGTRGDAHTRLIEAANAQQIIGAAFRQNIGLADGFFEIDTAALLSVVRVIRDCQPRIVLTNAPSDRHPDHGRASGLVERACFLSGLRKIETGQAAWRPSAVYKFIQDRYHKPDFVVDITAYMEQKMKAVRAFGSQFYNPDSQEPQTPISSAAFLDFLKARALEMGRPAGYTYAEGFLCARTLGVQDVFSLD